MDLAETISLVTSLEEAMEEKVKSEICQTEKESPRSVNEKLRAFLTEKPLHFESRLAGVIQNLAETRYLA
jgi:hypothetical protein